MYTSLSNRAFLIGLLSIALLSIANANIYGQVASKAAQTKPEYDADLSAELPRIPPRSPAEEQASFDVRPGYRVELVAAEPLVVDPVAFAFGAKGELFVIEMIDYSEQETEHLGRVARLVDVDGDGKMDQRTTFAEKLSWPTAIWPWQDGVLVAAPPTITWLRDTDGDGISDKKEVWFDGFGRSNVQGLVNSLRWSIDGYVQGATSSSGADIRIAPDLDTSVATLRGRDFSIDPISKKLTPTSGGGQHGMCFNRWGDKFATSNSDHLQQIVDIESWLTGHSSAVPIPSMRRSIALDGPQAEVFRSSPVEPWRIVRTRLRVSGTVPGVVEGGGRAAGYFTGATGTWIFDATAGYGDPDFDTAIVCDVGSNLVHRKRMLPKGLFWAGERIDKDSELLRGSDIWFRPVQIGDGPDGSLYVADMYREVIEHPKSLPPVIKRHLDLTSGNDRGRIWRVVPESRTNATTPIMPASLGNAELVKRLASPIAWQRRMASQLLVERKAVDVQKDLETLVTSNSSPEAQILAMHVLNRLGMLSPSVIKAGLTASHPRVNEQAAKLAGTPTRAAECQSELTGLASQTRDAHTQLALAQTASALPQQAKLQCLRSLMLSVDEPLTRAVLIVAAQQDSPLLFADAKMASREDQQRLAQWLPLILPAWVQSIRSEQGQPAQFTAKVAQVLGLHLANDSATREAWLDALCKLSGGSASSSLLSTLDAQLRSSIEESIAKNLTQIASSDIDEPQVGAIRSQVRLLRLLPEPTRAALAAQLLTPSMPEPIQTAVAESLLWADPNKGLEILLPKLRNMTPTLKRNALAEVLRYSQALERVAKAIEAKEISKTEIAPDVRQQLFSLPDKKLQARFKDLLNVASADRSAVITRYSPSLSQAGDTKSGQLVFSKVCAQCHRLFEAGSDVGPPLKQLADKSPEQLLDIILDPNREVDPKYLGYSVLLEDGRVLTGIIREESAGQIVLAEAGGKTHTLPRSEITRLQSTGLSLMPVGLEEQITAEQMRDLIAFLKQSQK